MIRMLLTIAAGVMLLFLGCYKADVQVPDYGSWGQPPPPAIITPANPNDKADLIRENQELRDRLAWVENQNHHDAHEYKRPRRRHRQGARKVGPIPGGSRPL